MAYQYLMIDNDNTLMDFVAAERKALAQTLAANHLPADAATLSAYHEINNALWLALERGETTQALLKVERFRRLFAHLQLDPSPAEAVAAQYAVNLGGYADLLPGAENFVRALYGKVKIALISNGVSAIQRGRLALCPLTPLFDTILISEEVGASKPDPKMLLMAMEQMGCTDKSQAVMMGDSLSADIPAAIHAGVDSIFFSTKGKTSPLPTYTVKSYEEALAILLAE